MRIIKPPPIRKRSLFRVWCHLVAQFCQSSRRRFEWLQTNSIKLRYFSFSIPLCTVIKVDLLVILLGCVTSKWKHKSKPHTKKEKKNRSSSKIDLNWQSSQCRSDESRCSVFYEFFLYKLTWRPVHESLQRGWVHYIHTVLHKLKALILSVIYIS